MQTKRCDDHLQDNCQLGELDLSEKGLQAAYSEYFKNGFDQLYPAASIQRLVKAYFEGCK